MTTVPAEAFATPPITKRFTASQVMNAMDILITGVDDVYQLLNFMTGDNLFTHQLPRAARWARPHLVDQFPWIVAELLRIDLFPWADMPPEDCAIAAGLIVRQLDRKYGSVEVKRPGGWTHVDPISELVEMSGDKPVIAVVVGDEA